MWLGTYTCLSHPLLPDKQCRTLDFYLNRCAKVVAHEIGHALSLHHVEGPFIDYLMYWDPADNYISKDDKGVNLSFQQKQAIVREAREQFSSR